MFIGFDSLVKMTFDHCIFQIVGERMKMTGFEKTLSQASLPSHFIVLISSFLRDQHLQSLFYNGYIGNVTLKISLILKNYCFLK